MLIVDDQPSVSFSLVYLLELAGFVAFKADSGPAALAVAARERIDGALVDINMPMMDGFAVCKELQIQARAAGRELRVWFMTGAATTLHGKRSAELGALGVLRKPFEFHALAEVLRSGFASPLPPPVPPATAT
jgi:DNA-binding response OmpR family regulator